MPGLYEPRTGDPVSASQQAELVRLARRTFTGPGVMVTPDGVHFRRMPSKAGASTTQFRVKRNAGEYADHLVCKTRIDAPEEEADVLVAKPRLFRKTPWDSVTPDNIEGPVRGQVRYVYDATNSTKRIAYDVNDPPGTSTAERNKRNEIISPQYLIDDELLVVKANTGVVVDEVPVMLLALTEERGWTVVYEQL